MRKRERYEALIAYFSEAMPAAASELHFSSPFQLLLAVMLSAQCTDKRVNMVTPALFEAYPTPEALSQASVEDIFALIRSVSYPNSKALHLKQTAQKLVADFGGEVPSDIKALMTLPGVGHKTANVVASIYFDAPVIAVDTHVFRVSHRMGLSEGKTPDAVEADLERHIPERLRPLAHHWLILHGRYVCTARSPKCGECGARKFCRFAFSKKSDIAA